MTITLSNGKEVNLYSARFLHIYLLWKSQSKELGGFQNGEAFSSQATGAQTTMQGDFHSNVMFFDTEDETGSITLNTYPGTTTTDILFYLFHAQHDKMTAGKLTADDLFGLNIVNDSTGEVITAEGCRLAGYPNNQGNEAAYALAWSVLVGYYHNDGNQPEDSLFSD
ncbi:hypothetical protein YK48G_03960 [Lentilactobacillus fungorum]|uniref:Uncharacterized protein n=1 Tax=Lentilactobacillus fungorum TaxID=2201250 RepID=A0ABQ3VYA8_9LACO|nr:hypothetical protein [Lentilactobacillus fungorum]GHP12971.1 hypothetical protein YK48G_03960 [Lentilactobacillus fungorum]